MVQLVAPGRFLDGVVFAVFLLIMAATTLFMFGQFHQMVVIRSAKDLGYFSTFMDSIFPFPKKQWTVNLTHIILFAILISIMSMAHHPAQDILKSEVEKEGKKKKKAASEEEDKK
mmetsp:Transcript_107098/g.169250  ORF Transcript_107098/g.169250 Transcript_107098/m.169250 type:complete len:115 (+) Transcript_107098:71-415(+)